MIIDDVKYITTIYKVNYEAEKMLVGYPNGESEWISIDSRCIYDLKRED